MKEFIADLLAVVCMRLLWTNAECVADWHGEECAVTVVLMRGYVLGVFLLVIAASAEKAILERRVS